MCTADRSPVDEPSADWREELSERLVSFRKRRAHLRPDENSTGNLELDFEDPDKPGDIRYVLSAPEAPEERDTSIDLEIGEPAVTHNGDSVLHESPPLEESGDEVMQLDSAPAETEEMSIGEPVAKSLPMEILVGSPTETAHEEGERSEGIFLAPLGRRFLAGLTDALVLILGAGVFGIIVWRVCGLVSLVPLNIVVFGLVALILIFAYFAVFTAIASATPGLLWMGCEIRSFQGGHPTVRESLWRAFGVLVSISAFMVGFIWAFVDSDSLTWHDRMSGTAITAVHCGTNLTGLEVEI
jgi:uncharacterized RDD family membrane protein YckC